MAMKYVLDGQGDPMEVHVLRIGDNVGVAPALTGRAVGHCG